MKTVIYKGHKKQDRYLYIESEDDFSRVPEALLQMMGKLEQVMILDLTLDRKLASADTRQVILALEQKGYFLQIPDVIGDKLALAGTVSSRPFANDK